MLKMGFAVVVVALSAATPGQAAAPKGWTCAYSGESIRVEHVVEADPQPEKRLSPGNFKGVTVSGTALFSYKMRFIAGSPPIVTEESIYIRESDFTLKRGTESWSGAGITFWQGGGANFLFAFGSGEGDGRMFGRAKRAPDNDQRNRFHTLFTGATPFVLFSASESSSRPGAATAHLRVPVKGFLKAHEAALMKAKTAKGKEFRPC